MNFNYVETIGALNFQQRMYFYELFAHFLTVSMRGVLFFEGIPNEERIDRAKGLNEIAHRITYKVFSLHKNPQAKGVEADMLEMIEKIIEKHPATEEDVNLALDMSYRYVIDNESDDI